MYILPSISGANWFCGVSGRLPPNPPMIGFCSSGLLTILLAPLFLRVLCVYDLFSVVMIVLLTITYHVAIASKTAYANALMRLTSRYRQPRIIVIRNICGMNLRHSQKFVWRSSHELLENFN